MSAALHLPPRMTVTEFLTWDEDDVTGRRWELHDGVPLLMAPAADRHGTIQGNLGGLLFVHLRATRPSCRLVTEPGIVPHLGADHNFFVPDLGVTCDPPRGAVAVPNPVLLVEILSPSNVARTRAKLWAYASIPSVVELLVVHSDAVRAEWLMRQPHGAWPTRPTLLGADDELHLDSIALSAALREIYANTGLLEHPSAG